MYNRYTLLLLLLFLAACAGKTTETRPDVLFREGEEFYTSRRFEDAIAQWKRVKESYYSPELSTMAELKIADAQFENKSYIEAAAAYEEFRKLHPAHEKADYALYRLALSHFAQITGIDTDQNPVKNAAQNFTEFLKKYPKSTYAAEAAEKLELCTTKQLQYEIYVGSFYYRTEKYAAAIKRLEEALAKFPTHPSRDEIYYVLGASYLRSGNQEKARTAFNRLQSDFPASPYVEEARKVLEKYY